MKGSVGKILGMKEAQSDNFRKKCHYFLIGTIISYFVIGKIVNVYHCSVTFKLKSHWCISNM